VFTVASLAELHRATLHSTSDDEYIIQTTILKSPQRIAEFKICKIPDERICPLRWFKSWFAEREPEFQTRPKNSGGSAMRRDKSKLTILAKPQEQQCNLPALARHTQLPPLGLLQSPNSQNIMSVVCKLIDSRTTLTLPLQQGSTMTRTITLKLEKYLVRQKRNLTMKKMKNKREHYQKRLNMRDP
ncbi:MAG: hypothetical protein EZS28_055784, partial [Streblomastix strix]